MDNKYTGKYFVKKGWVIRQFIMHSVNLFCSFFFERMSLKKIVLITAGYSTEL